MQFTSIIMVQKSSDEGLTWGEPEVLFPEEGTFSRQAIQILSNGRWIFATWLCEDSAEGLTNDPTEFRVSDDQGQTWRRVRMPESNGRVHANIVEVEEGHLVAFLRSRFADIFILVNRMILVILGRCLKNQSFQITMPALVPLSCRLEKLP